MCAPNRGQVQPLPPRPQPPRHIPSLRQTLPTPSPPIWCCAQPFHTPPIACSLLLPNPRWYLTQLVPRNCYRPIPAVSSRPTPLAVVLLEGIEVLESYTSIHVCIHPFVVFTPLTLHDPLSALEHKWTHPVCGCILPSGIPQIPHAIYRRVPTQQCTHPVVLLQQARKCLRNVCAQRRRGALVVPAMRAGGQLHSSAPQPEQAAPGLLPVAQACGGRRWAGLACVQGKTQHADLRGLANSVCVPWTDGCTPQTGWSASERTHITYQEAIEP